MTGSGFISREHLGQAGSALIRVDGGESGARSVMRMLALGRALRDGENISVCFAVGADLALTEIRRAGFAAHAIAGAGGLAALISEQKPEILILDGNSGFSRAQAQALREDVILLAAIEDNSELRLACDFAYYPPLPQAKILSWAGARTVPRIGWEYALPGLDPHRAPMRPAGARPSLLVTMGRSDPAGLTHRAARLLAPLDALFRIRFVIGGGLKDAGKVAAGIVALKSNYETVEGADDLSTEYASADLALCAFDAAAYELAAFGVPAIYLGLTEDDVRSAGAFAGAGMGVSLGTASGLTDAEILDAVKTLMHNSVRRREMRNCGFAAMKDGGAVRIAADLARALREEKAPVRAAR